MPTSPAKEFFIPLTDTTLEYINLLFLYLARSYGFSIVDEQAGWRLRRAAGCARLGEGLDPDGGWGSVELEQRVLTMLVVKQAFICQNINLANEASVRGSTFTGYIARFVMGGGDVPGLGVQVRRGEGRAVVPGRQGRPLRGLHPALLRRHARGGGGRLPVAVKWAAFDDEVPKPYKEPDRVVDAVPRPHADTVDS